MSRKIIVTCNNCGRLQDDTLAGRPGWREPMVHLSDHRAKSPQTDLCPKCTRALEDALLVLKERWVTAIITYAADENHGSPTSVMPPREKGV
jgi:hypothetical protein